MTSDVAADLNDSDSGNQMGRPRKITKAQLRAAVTGSQGNRTVIAKELQISLRSLGRYLERFPDIQEAYREEREYLKEELQDTARIKLREAIEKGEGWAIKFVLSTLGKEEGFSERHEISGPEGAPFQLTVNIIRDDSPITGGEE